MACITLAIEHPAERGECRVFNQFTEQFTINQLAELVAAARADRGLETTIDHLPNPRVEHEDHYYNARNSGLLDLGLKPHYLGSTLVESMIDLVEKHVDLIDPVLLQQPSVDWRSGGNEVWAKYANQAMDGASANGMRDVIERATAGPVNIES
jgi:UDP-sulfoquinovose synthase